MKIRMFQHAPRTVLGYRADGRAIHPIAGGSEAPPAGDPPAGDPPPDPPSGSKPPMDADAWKAQARTNEATAKAALAERDAAQAERDALKASLAKVAGLDLDANSGEPVDLDKAIDARIEAERKRSDARLVRAEVKAAAVGKLNDPTDALTFLDLTSFEVGDDGSVDEAAIASAIDDLVSKKPYLAAQGGGRGSADGGARNGTGPTQLTEAEVQRMTPAEIRKAQDEGRLKRYLTGS